MESKRMKNSKKIVFYNRNKIPLDLVSYLGVACKSCAPGYRGFSHHFRSPT